MVTRIKDDLNTDLGSVTKSDDFQSDWYVVKKQQTVSQYFINEIKIKQNISLRHIARLSEIPLTTILNLYSGRIKIPSNKTFGKLINLYFKTCAVNKE